MGRYVVNAGSEMLKSDDRFILYLGIEQAEGKPSYHISMADANALEWEIFNALDTALRSHNTPKTLLLLCSPEIRPWWLRVVRLLHSSHPETAPLKVLQLAWNRIY